MSSSLNTVQSIPKYGVSLHCFFFPYKDKIYISDLMRKNTGQRDPLPWHILHIKSSGTKRQGFNKS